MGKVSREHSFQLIYRSDGTWRIHQLNTSYIAKNAEMSCKTSVTTCVTAFYRFAKPLQRYPLMGTCNFRGYLSTNTCYQNIPKVLGKIPRNTGKIPKYNVISSKKFGKTLGKRLLPESNRSWRPIPGGRKFQNHIIGQ